MERLPNGQLFYRTLFPAGKDRRGRIPARARARQLSGIPFYIPSAPFPPKARGRWGFDWGKDISEHLAGRVGEGKLLKQETYQHLHTAALVGES